MTVGWRQQRAARHPGSHDARQGRRWPPLVGTIAVSAALLSVAGVVSAFWTANQSQAATTVNGDLDADVVQQGPCAPADVGPQSAAGGAQVGPCPVLATLHGSVDHSVGFVTFTPVHARGKPGLMWLAATDKGDGKWRLSGRGDGGSRLDLNLDDGRLRGTGVDHGGQAVTVRGYGGVERPNVGEGRLLQLGHAPLGDEVAAALSARYKIETADPGSYSRDRVLAKPHLLDHVAGVVVGPDVDPQTLRASGLLRALANGHRWVVIADPKKARVEPVRGILPVSPAPDGSPAVALRRNGPRGGSDSVRSVVIFPGPPLSAVPVTRSGGPPKIVKMALDPGVARRLRDGRIAFFARELQKRGGDEPWGSARPPSSGGGTSEPKPDGQGRGPGAAPAHAGTTRLIQASGGNVGLNCTLEGTPATAGSSVYSCYRIDVVSTYSMPMTPLGNYGQPWCQQFEGLNDGGTLIYEISCPGSGTMAGSIQSATGQAPDNADGLGASVAQYGQTCGKDGGDFAYLIASEYPSDSNYRSDLSGLLNNPNYFTIAGNQYNWSDCPSAGTQTAQYEVVDSFYALYEPGGAQTVMAQVTGNAVPVENGEQYGPGNLPIMSGNGIANNGFNPVEETAWALGYVNDTLTYAPPPNAAPDGSQNFNYTSTNQASFPFQTITDSSSSNESETSNQYTVGVSPQIGFSGKSITGSVGGTFQWSTTTSISATTEVSVPDWQVLVNLSNAQGAQVDYQWTTNTTQAGTALPWGPPGPGGMQCGYQSNGGCKAPWGSAMLNELNSSTWSPSSQTTWQSQGNGTGGIPTVTTQHSFGFADHFSEFVGTNGWDSPGSGKCQPEIAGTDGCFSQELGVSDLWQNASFNSPTYSSDTTATPPTNVAQEIDLCDPLVTQAGQIFPLCATPTVSKIEPEPQGPAAGGNSVTIKGSGFTAATGVSFGQAAAANIAVNSDTEIVVNPVPAGPAAGGTVDVTVTAPGGTSSPSSKSKYTYVVAPTVGAVSPTAGALVAGAPVTVTGTGFSAGSPTVAFGGNQATGVTVNSDTQLTATPPTGTAGAANSAAVDVTVTADGGTSATSVADQYTYFAPPVVTGVLPVGENKKEVTVGGSNFYGVSGFPGWSGANGVYFGTAQAEYVYNSPTSITATVPPGQSGTVDVSVVTPGGTSATSAIDRYSYTGAPVVSSVSPSQGPAAGGNPVTITGVGFAAASAVTFGPDNSPAGFSVDSDTQITVPAAPAGGAGVTVDVTVTGPAGTSATSSADQYTYVAVPTVTNVDPPAGPLAAGTSVSVSGTGFIGAPGGVSVSFGGSPPVTPSSVSSDGTQLTVVAPAGAAAGAVDVIVTTPSGPSATSAADQYTYAPIPTVSTIDPASGPATANTAITITGTGFSGFPGTPSVSFGGTAATGVTVDGGSGGSQLHATAPAGTAGPVDVTVTTPGGSSGPVTFTYLPVVSAVAPASGSTAGGTPVTVTGSGFTGATVVNFGANAATGLTVKSDTQLTVTSPAGAAGKVDVTVTVPAGTSATSSADQFAYAGSLPGVVVSSAGSDINWFLGTSLTTGAATTTFSFGTNGEIPLMGDWNGDGSETPGVFSAGTFTLGNSMPPTAGSSTTFTYGDPTGYPVVGDWNGDGTDDVAVVAGGVWQTYLVPSGTKGSFSFGPAVSWPGVVPVAGDWDGNGTDGVGIYIFEASAGTVGRWELRSTPTSGTADVGTFTYNPGTTPYPVVGDWDANGTDTVGVVTSTTPANWLLNNANDGSAPDITFQFGGSGIFPVVWDDN